MNSHDTPTDLDVADLPFHHIRLCISAVSASMRVHEDDRAACYATILALGNFTLAIEEDVDGN